MLSASTLRFWLVLLLAGFTTSLLAQTANVQIIHNSPDPGAAVVDVYIDAGAAPAVEDLAFRDATGFLALPAGATFDVGIAPGNSTGPGDTWPNVVQYRPWQVNAREIAHSLNLRFGDVAVLRGYTVLQDTTLILYWEALAPTPTDYSVLLHLETAPGAPVIALDHAIAETLVSTRTWEPGTFYRDPVALPPDLPAGALAIRVGMYPAGNPEAAIAIDDQTRLVIGEIILDALKK